MMERTGRRGSWLDLAWVLTISGALSTTACRDSKKEDAAPIADAAPAPTVAAATAAAPETDAGAASATKPAEGELEDVPDGGADGGGRKRRRLVTAGTDAGSAETQTAAPAPTAETSAPKAGKRPPAPMGNEEVYGASAASAAPVLKKKPLPDDDPYPKSAH